MADNRWPSEKRAEMIRAIKEEYPKCDKQVFSVATRPWKTGCILIPEAMELAGLTPEEVWDGKKRPDAPQEKKKDNRKKDRDWHVRLSGEAHELLNARIKRLGFSTKQTYLELLLMKEMDSEREYIRACREISG